MAARNFTIVVRDSDLSTLGTADAYTALELHPRFNAVGSWSLTYPAGSLGASLLAAGRGIQVFRKGSSAPVISGPVMAISEKLDRTRKKPQLVFSGPCDNVILAARTAYPTPGAALSSQSSEYDTRSGVAETVMKAYVNANVGPGALAPRRATGLAVEPNGFRGSSVAASARFDNLLALLQNLAASGGVGFQVRQSGTQLVFSVYLPVDRSGLIRFATSSGSLGDYGFELSGPSATAAIVGDGGSGLGRTFAEFVDADAQADWGIRYEVFVDQSNTLDTTQVQLGGLQALGSGAPQGQVSFTPVDTPQRAYGIDYGLGDKVSVQLDTASVIDVVREVAITDSTGGGIVVTPTVGGPGASNSSVPPIYKVVRAIGIAVGLLQRRK